MSIDAHVLCCRLAYNNITNDGKDISGVQALADSLRDNSSLTQADVRYNSLGDDGKSALRAAVQGKGEFKLLL